MSGLGLIEYAVPLLATWRTRNPGGPDRNWNFQPVQPVSLTRDWNLITRPVMPFYNIVPHETGPGRFERTAGLGDMELLEHLSPAHSAGIGAPQVWRQSPSFEGRGSWRL